MQHCSITRGGRRRRVQSSGGSPHTPPCTVINAMVDFVFCYQVSCGSWHIACIAIDGQVHKPNEVQTSVALQKENSIIDSREIKYGSYEGQSNGRTEQLEGESCVESEKHSLPPVDLQCLSSVVACEKKGASRCDRETGDSLNADNTKKCLHDVSTSAIENNQDEKPSIGLNENELDFLNNDAKGYSDTTETKKPFFHLLKQDEKKKCSGQFIHTFAEEDEWSVVPSGNRADGSDTVLQDRKQQEVEYLAKQNHDWEKGTKEDPNNCSSMQSDEFDFNINCVTMDEKPCLKELQFDLKYEGLETEEKSDVRSSCRQRSHSELLTSTDNNVDLPQTFCSSFHSASLGSLSCYKEDDTTCQRQHTLTLGSRKIKGPLNREKKPARMLRRTVCNLVSEEQ